MREAFIKDFEGTCLWPITVEDLTRCVQGPHESTRRWIQRWQDVCMASTGISPDTAIHIFRQGCRYEPLVAKLKRHWRQVTTIADLMEIAKRYSDADDTKDTSDEEASGRGRQRRHPHHDNWCDDYRPSGNYSGGKRRSDGSSELVANASYDQRNPKSSRRDGGGSRNSGPYTGKRLSAAQLLNSPCIYHRKEGRPATHTTAECVSLKELEKARRAKAGANADQDKYQERPADEGFGHSVGSLHTFTGITNRREKKVLAHAISVNSVVADVPWWLNWSEQEITWSRADQAPRIEYPGRVALVMKPKITDYWLSKTLMDGGSSITSCTMTPSAA
jgi:hypothetical protein